MSKKYTEEEIRNFFKQTSISGSDLSKMIEVHDQLPRHYSGKKILPEQVQSRVEYDFIYAFQKMALAWVEAQKRVDVGGRYFILDFLISREGKNIGIEIDGKEWHDTKKDSERDKLILQESIVDEIIRFEAADAYYSPSLCIKYLYEKHPFLFHHEYKENYDKHVKNWLKNQLYYQGIVEYELHESKQHLGYTIDKYRVDFMTPEQQEEHFVLQEGNPEVIDRKDYSYEKFTTIKSMISNG